MKKLNNEEMMEVKGGGLGWKIISAIGAGIVFFIGVVDGFINPRKCN